MYGPPVIVSQRAQMEVAFLEATWKTLDPVGITNRWINHTIHPAQTPGAAPAAVRSDVGHGH